MFTYLVNSNTSVVAVQTNNLTSGQYALVHVPPASNIGQIITIRDTYGFLSTPQLIIVSTTGGANIEGASSFQIQQGYGYLTLKAESSTTWSILDQNAFSSPTQSYSMRGITYGAMNVIETAYIKSAVSTTGAYLGINSQIFSTLETVAPMFANTIAVNSFTTHSDRYYQNGSILVTGSTTILSSLIMPGDAKIDGNKITLGSLIANSSMILTGPLVFSTGSGKLSVRNNVSTNYRLYVENTMSTGGTTSVSSLCRVQNNVNVSSLRTGSVYASRLQTNEFVFSANAYIRNRPDISVVSPTYTDVVSPVIEIQQGLFHSTNTNAQTYISDIKTNYMRTGALTIAGTSINASGVTRMQLNNALISNADGSLQISSIVTSNLITSNIIGTIPLFTTGNLNTSSVTFQNAAHFLQSTSMPTVIADTCYTNNTTTNLLVYGNTALEVVGLNLSSITVSSAFIADQMSSFSAPSAIINNQHAYFTTSNIETGTATTSSLYGVSYISGNNSITMNTPSLTTASTVINLANVAQPISSATLNTTSITIGTPYDYSTMFSNDPYMTTSTISGLTSNTPYEFINGLGIPYNPLRIKASVDRTVNIYFQNTSNSTTKYLTLQYTYQNNGSPAGSAGIRMVNRGITSTIITFNASPISTIRTAYLSNFPIDANPILSTYQYYLTGPTTYSPPSTTTSRNIIVAGGSSQTTTLSYSSDGGVNWVPLKFTPLTSSCLGLAWGSDKWLAVGEGTNATIAYSYSGTSWYSLGKSIFTIRACAAAWNGSVWVGVGEGTNSLAYSRDGVNWVGLGSTIFTRGNSVAWNGSIWVAAGQGPNTVAYSLDGVSWTGSGSTIFTAGNAVAWGSTIWVAVGQGSSTLAYSIDGMAWAGAGSTALTTANAVAWSGSSWLAGGGTQVARSSDGINWSNQTISTISNVRGITYSSSNWIITGAPLTNSLAYSADGIDWTGVTRSTIFTQGYALANREQLPRGIQPPAAQFVPIIACGTDLQRTTDGITWTTLSNPFVSNIYCLAWNGTWVAGGSAAVAYSANGISWTRVTLSNMISVLSVAWGLGTWIAVGTGTGGYTSAKSTNGVNWTEISYTAGNFFATQANGIAWAENVWVAVGQTTGSGILYSLDGVTWSPPLNIVFNTGRCVANNGDYWIAGGDYVLSSLAYSYDGANWAPLAVSPFSTTANGVAWGNNLWVAVGSGTNSIAYSYNGINWFGIGLAIFTTGVSVTYNGLQWFATGTGPNTLASSFDGVTWTGNGLAVGGAAIVAQKILPNSLVNINEPKLIRWDLSGTMLVSPSSIENPLNSAFGWNSRASSLDGYTANASLSFIIRQTASAFMMGFSEAPRTTNSFTALNYAFYVTAQNTLIIYESGAEVANFGVVNLDDALSIKFTGTQIIYYVNSFALRTVARPIGNPLYLSSSFRSPGCRVDEITFQPLFQITPTQPIPDAYSYSASIRPVRDDIQYVTYSMQAPPVGYDIGNFEFNLPISGNLSSQSTVLYADFLLNSTKLFSTSYVVSGFLQQPSTYNISFMISSFVSTTVNDTINLNIRTQRGTGESYFYTGFSTPTSVLSTVIKNNVYNLSSISYLQFYHTSFNSGIQTSDVAMSLNSFSTVQNYIDSNYNIQMNKGYIVWPNRLAGITINNRYNDMQTRNLTYTGSLYNASDSNLKSDIEYAETDSIYDRIDRLPLRYYGFNSAYMSTFQPVDRHQIGVLTTEVAAEFPEIVNSVEPDRMGLSSLNTIDRGQLKFMHLGATQRLIQKISTLSGCFKDLSQ